MLALLPGVRRGFIWIDKSPASPYLFSMAKEPDSQIENLNKSLDTFKADIQGRWDKLTETLSKSDKESGEFKGRFNTTMAFLGGTVSLVLLLTATITKMVYEQGQEMGALKVRVGNVVDHSDKADGRLAAIETHSNSSDTRLATIESKLTDLAGSSDKIAAAAQKQPQALNAAVAAVNDIRDKVTDLANGVVSETQAQDSALITELGKLLPLMNPGDAQELRLTFRTEHLQRTDGKGIVLRAALPGKIDMAAKASVHVQSIDIPPDYGSYLARAKLLEGGSLCEVTIFSSDPDRIKERLADTGITASLLVRTPLSGFSQTSSHRYFASAQPMLTDRLP